MKFLIVQHTNMIGGSLNAAKELVETLQSIKKNIEVEIYINNSLKNKTPIEKKNNNKTVMDKYGVPTFDYFNGCNSIIRVFIKYLFNKRNYKYWKHFFKNNKYNIVILNTSVLWPLRKIIQHSGAKCFCYVRETVKGNNESIMNKIIRNELSKCDKVFFLTKYDMSTWDLKAYKQYVIPETVKLPDATLKTKKALRKELGLVDEKFYVIYLGGMQRLKGADIIISTMELIASSKYCNKIKLLFLGDSGDEPFSLKKKIIYHDQIRFQKKWNKRIKKNNIESLIQKVGYQSNVYEWIMASDVVVFPVREVHQARPMYEAGVLKHTIIVPEFENYKEDLINEYNGLTFKPGDPKDLAKKIVDLYENNNMLRNLAERNYEMACKNHVQEVIQKKLEEIVYCDL